MDTYKEKYEAARKKSKMYYDNAKEAGDYSAVARYENIFPELSESEDERIRNAAIRACKYMVDNFENSTKDYADAIAWLEKLKDSVPVAKHIQDIADAFEDGRRKGLEKQKEEEGMRYAKRLQKPAEYPEKGNEYWFGFNEGKGTVLDRPEEYGLCKPADVNDEWIENYWQHEKVNNPYSYDKGDEVQFDHDGFVRFCKRYCQKPAEDIIGKAMSYFGAESLLDNANGLTEWEKFTAWLYCEFLRGLPKKLNQDYIKEQSKVILDSARNELSEMPDSTKLIALWEEEKKGLEEKDLRDDKWRLAQNAFMDGFAEGCVINNQKPAEWSEEDEMIYQHCKVILHDYGYDDWLKSHCSKHIKNEQEWSLEDELGLQNTIALVQGYRDSACGEYEIECCDYSLNFLKSLRPLQPCKVDDFDKEMEERMVENYAEGRES